MSTETISPVNERMLKYGDKVLGVSNPKDVRAKGYVAGAYNLARLQEGNKISYLDDAYFPADINTLPRVSIAEAREILEKTMEADGTGFKTHSLTKPCYAYTSGSDPELFVVDEKGKIQPFHATLTRPTSNNGNCHADGFVAEMTPRSEYCLAYHTDYLQQCMEDAYDRIAKFNTTNKTKWRFSPVDYLPVPKALRMRVPAEISQLGCKPSMNAYGDTTQFREGIMTPYRTAGCHMHFGMSPIKKLTKKATDQLVQFVDATAGVMSIALIPQQDPRRRKLYGRAGEYRLPAHGLEYRVHSSWVLGHPALWHLMFEITRAAVMAGLAGVAPLYKFNSTTVKSIINTCNAEKARSLLKQYPRLYKGLVKHLGTTSAEVAYNIALGPKGINAFIDLTEVVTNWRLNTYWDTHSEGLGCCWKSKAQQIVGTKSYLDFKSSLIAKDLLGSL